MPVKVGDDTYIVGKPTKSAICVQCPTRKTWHIYKRNANETDSMMQHRILESLEKKLTTAGASTPVDEPASPAVSELGAKRPKDKLSPQSAASMPPPPPKRPSTRGSRQVEATGMQLDFGARPAVASSSSSSSAKPQPDATLASGSSVVKRLEKRIREIERLQQQESDGRRLCAEERAKVAELAAIERQVALLKQPTPTPTQTPTQTPLSSQTPTSELSGASTQLRAPPHTQPAAASSAAASSAASCNAAQTTAQSLLFSPPRRAPTRHTSAAVLQQLEEERAARSRAREAAKEAARAAEHDMWGLLRAPLDSWDDAAFWQLAMCEFALEHLGDVASTPKQLQLEFRAACEAARHPDEVPRLRGSLQIDALQDALDGSRLLRDELQRQLARYKRLYGAIFTGFGRFRKVAPQPGETLLGLMQRTHDDALKWRPPGRPPAEKLALVSKEKGVYRADWREDTWLTRHEDAGRTLSLRGTVGVTTGGLRRLKNLPEGERPAQEGALLLRGS